MVSPVTGAGGAWICDIGASAAYFFGEVMNERRPPIFQSMLGAALAMMSIGGTVNPRDFMDDETLRHGGGHRGHGHGGKHKLHLPAHVHRARRKAERHRLHAAQKRLRIVRAHAA